MRLPGLLSGAISIQSQMPKKSKQKDYNQRWLGSNINDMKWWSRAFVRRVPLQKGPCR
jgi:hypothetical protein